MTTHSLDFSFKSYDLSEILNLPQPTGKTVQGLSDLTNPYIPQSSSLVDVTSLQEVASILFSEMRTSKSPCWLYGPAGTGKTTLVRHYASILHLPLFSIAGGNRVEFQSFIGQYKLGPNQEMIWVEGPLSLAYRHGGIFLINEISLIDPGELVRLNDILDGTPLIVPETGDIIPRHPEFQLIVTDNSNGSGDDTASYVGVQVMNQALLNRFYILQFDRLTVDEELKLLRREFPLADYPLLDDSRLNSMVKFWDCVSQNKDASGSNMELPLQFLMTHRDLSRWCKMVVRLAPSYQRLGRNALLSAARVAFIDRGTPSQQSALLSLLTAVFGG